MMNLREAVRKRPGMYFGSIQTSYGRVIALGYLFDLLYAGAQRGQAREIHLTLQADRYFSLWGDGPAPLGLFQLEDPFAETEPYQHDPAWQARWVCAAASHFHIDSYADGLHHVRHEFGNASPFNRSLVAPPTSSILPNNWRPGDSGSGCV